MILSVQHLQVVWRSPGTKCGKWVNKYFGTLIYPFKGPFFKLILTMRVGQNMQIHNFLKSVKWTQPIGYNVHLKQNSAQCKPQTKIIHHSANRGSGVVFLIASSFLQQKTDVVTTKGAAVNSLYINILCSILIIQPQTSTLNPKPFPLIPHPWIWSSSTCSGAARGSPAAELRAPSKRSTKQSTAAAAAERAAAAVLAVAVERAAAATAADKGAKCSTL